MRKYFFARKPTAGAAGMALLAIAAMTAILFCAGCTDYFRPVVNPVALPAGDTQALSFLHVIAEGPSTGTCADGSTAANPSACSGSASQSTVADDLNWRDKIVGREPVHGALVNGIVFVANKADDTLSYYTPDPNLAPGTAHSLNLCPTTNPNCPPNPGAKPAPVMGPQFVGSTESGTVYVAEKLADSVAVVTTSPVALSTTVCTHPTVSGVCQATGDHPVALAELPNGNKLYTANGNGTASVIQASDHTLLGAISLPGTTPAPVWVTVNSDGSAVYVLDPANKQVDIIDPNADLSTTPNTTSPNTVATTSDFMYFDSRQGRLYVTNGDTSGTISVFQPGPLDSSNHPTLTPIAGSPFSTHGNTPLSLTVVHTTSCDGCIYIANSTPSSPSGTVTVLSPSLSLITTIAVGGDPVSIAASADGSRVYVANHHPIPATGTPTTQPGTSIIDTSSNKVVPKVQGETSLTTEDAPFQNPACTADSSTCPRNAPVWVVGF